MVFPLTWSYTNSTATMQVNWRNQMTTITTAPASADELGTLLAQIATLTKKADAIKDAMKDIASSGGDTVFEGALFKCTYTECDRTIFDKATFVKVYGEEAYKSLTKTTAVFTIKTTAR
jgi:hypothetical protein